VYQPAGDALRLAWNVTIDDAAGNHWWDVRVDAVSGELLHRDDWIDAETGAQESANPDEYVVFELPKESPSDGPRTTVVDPALPSASPFGWHDTDGAGGAEFTITRGNNAHGYADTDDDNMPDPIPGSEPDGGPGLVFDFPLDLNLDPIEYLSASVTNLFYFNNIIHDVFYGYGFDEASGNFQENNYGNGGLGSDYVFAEAQDGSGKNNANFGTPPDGQNPRMQMYRWNPPLTQIVEVLPPSPIAGEYLASPANFGPALTTTGITGTVTLVDDGVGTTTDGCEDLIGFPAGNVALIDRGTCTFVSKVLNAQEAGAIAVIVVNNVPGPPVTMGGDDPTVTISSVMISLDDGNEFKANLPLDANLRDSGGTIPARDSDLDNGVIAHEYGHGISNRLTGGPANVSCLNNEEQMGEGWSDYTALVLTAVASDLPDTPRGIGTYVVFQPPDGLGIRLFP
ncbi:MAG: M36 family metallopeptidase, partial [Planctomycetaceae bacterium]